MLGAFSVAGFLIFSTLGLELSGIGFGVVLIYAQPLLVAGMARLALGERLSIRQVAGLFVGWAGIALAVLGELSGTGRHVWQAALLFLGSAVCFAVGTIVVKAVTTGPRAVPLPPALLLGLVYGSLPLIAFATTPTSPSAGPARSRSRSSTPASSRWPADTCCSSRCSSAATPAS